MQSDIPLYVNVYFLEYISIDVICLVLGNKLDINPHLNISLLSFLLVLLPLK